MADEIQDMEEETEDEEETETTIYDILPTLQEGIDELLEDAKE